MRSFTFHATPTICFGAGLAASGAQDLRALLGERVLVVTDAGIRRLGLADPLIAGLQHAGCQVHVFDEVLPEPPEKNVEAAAAIAIEARVTGIVGFGGGSAMGVAKVVALLVGSGDRLDALCGVEVARGPRLPLALVPTTAGTGSEATPVAILTAGGIKKEIVSHHQLPDAAILDLTLTLGLPPTVTAATGADAMVHAIEAFASVSPNQNAISQGLARQALRRLGANLRRVVEDGSDMACGAMLLGSCMAGQAFANAPVAAVHALAYPIGGRFHAAALPGGVPPIPRERQPTLPG